MRVLVACELSGTVRDAFAALGHDAWSCDLMPSDRPGNHIQGDAVSTLSAKSWDLVIAHPPCTFFTTTGARWFYDPKDKTKPHPRFPDRAEKREDSVGLFMSFVDCAPMWAIENPIGYMSTRYRKPDQIIQPFQFGDDASKATCLWLGGLPKLIPTKIVDVTYCTTSTGKRFSKWFWDTSALKGPARSKARSKTFQGIADAMALQWGGRA